MQHPPPWRVELRRDAFLRDGRPVVLRPLGGADAEGMAAFFAGLTEREVYYFFRLDAAAARRLALEAERDPAYRLVATDEAGERVLGYAFLQWRDEGHPGFGICLRREAQSSGLGRILVDHLFSTAAESGVGRVALTVHPDNGRALRLYQRAGFRLVGEFINQHQGVKQYRMEADLSAPRPAILDELAIVPIGGVGVGMAAAEVQSAIERKADRLPLLLDRPTQPRAPAIFVADLAVLGPRWDQRDDSGSDGAHWIAGLDDEHLLIGGVGVAAVARACRRYADLLAASPSGERGPGEAAVSVRELVAPELVPP